MKKKSIILIFGILIILLSSFTSASTLQDNILEAWHYEEASGNAIGELGIKDGTNTNIGYQVKGINGYGYNYASSGTTDLGTSVGSLNSDVNESFSYNVWYNATDFNNDGFLISFSEGYFGLHLESDDSKLRVYKNPNGFVLATAFALNTSQQYMVTLTHNITNDETKLYLDSVLIGTDAQTLTVTGSASMRICSHSGGSAGAKGICDEPVFWRDKILTQAEVTELWAGETGSFYPFAAAADNINLSAEPANGTQFNTELLLVNISSNTTNIVNITLYVDGVYNDSVNDSPAGDDVTHTFNLTFSSDDELNFTYYFSVTDGTDTENTSTNTVFIDNVLPNINWTRPASDNSTIVVGNLSSLILLHDPNIYSYEYNITWSNGTNAYNYSNNTLTGLTLYNVTDTSDMTAYGGFFTASLEVCDGHTDNKISFSNVQQFSEYLQFDNVNISLENKANTKSLGYQKLSDRYSFSFETSTPGSMNSFLVESTEKIRVLHGKTRYQGHLVIGHKWVDFETDGIKNIVINQLSDYKVRVIVITHQSRNNFVFHSIGELNCVTESKEFFSINATEIFDSSVLAGADTVLTLNVTYNGSFIPNAINASLYWNGTEYSTGGVNNSNHYFFSNTVSVPSVDDNVNVSFYWTYSFNGTDYNTSANNQSILFFGIDNCTTYTQTWVNYTLRDELNESVLVGDIEYLFDFVGGTHSGVYAGSGTNSSSFAFCLSPPTANFITDITLQYSVSGYEIREYINSNYTVDNITEQVNLYSLETGVSTAITIHVIDDEDNDLENILIKAYRWDIDTNTDVLVETELTDADGNVVLNLKTGSEYYSFLFYEAGVLELSTSRFKLFSTSYEYTLRDIVDAPLTEWLQILGDITSTLTYDNSTEIVDFTWDYGGSIISEFCLKVTDNNVTYYDTCSSTVDSSLTYTINTLNVTYTAIASVTTTTGNNYVLHILGIDTRTGWDSMGFSLRILMSLIIFLVISLIALIEKNLAIIGGLIAIVGLFWFGLLPIGWPGVIGLVCIGIISLVIMNKRQ